MTSLYSHSSQVSQLSCATPKHYSPLHLSYWLSYSDTNIRAIGSAVSRTQLWLPCV